MKLSQKALARINSAASFLLVLYFGSYLALTVKGNYMEWPVPSGNFRIAGGAWAVRDIVLWQPKGTRLSVYGVNVLGAIYGPLIFLDRKLWHREKHLYPEMEKNLGI
ncbi:MAG TPA: hypothetical protein VGO67_12715 [Verrucomicrobiae bacterium]